MTQKFKLVRRVILERDEGRRGGEVKVHHLEPHGWFIICQPNNILLWNSALAVFGNKGVSCKRCLKKKRIK